MGFVVVKGFQFDYFGVVVGQCLGVVGFVEDLVEIDDFQVMQGVCLIGYGDFLVVVSGNVGSQVGSNCMVLVWFSGILLIILVSSLVWLV